MINRCGVVGTGKLGTQIAEFLLINGHSVVVKTRSIERKDRFTSNLRARLNKDRSDDVVEQMMEKILVSTDYNSLSDVDIVIEAIVEDLSLKQKEFIQIEQVVKKGTILATNTSSVSINKIAIVLQRPECFLGLHFFNPVRKMMLVEVVHGQRTSEDVEKIAIRFVESLGKKAVKVRDSPAFIVNRILLPQINEAVKMLEGGVATKEDIDTSVKMGLNHPMGPFELADFIGIDVCVAILEELSKSLGDDGYLPASTLTQMVREGKLGLKSKEGFYKY